jgi:signal transduction histidine kinase/CheY-like chemotaxis protein
MITDTLLPDLEESLASESSAAFVLGRDFRFLAVNDRFAEVAGLDRHEILGNSKEDVTTGALDPDDTRRRQQVLVFGTVQTVTMPMRTGTGIFELRREGSLKDTPYIVGRMTGLTDRNDVSVPDPSSDTAASGAADFSSLVHDMTVGAFLLDADLRIIAINEAFYNAWNIDRQALGPGQRFIEFMDLSRPMRAYKLDDGGWCSHAEDVANAVASRNIIHRDIPLVDGRVVRASGATLSAGRILLTHEDLGQGEPMAPPIVAPAVSTGGPAKLLRSVLDNMPASVMVYDRNGNFLFDNRMRREALVLYDDVMREGRTLRDYLDFVHRKRLEVASGDEELDALHDADPEEWKARQLVLFGRSYATREFKTRNGWVKITDRRLEDGTFIRMWNDIDHEKEREASLDSLHSAARNALKTLNSAICTIPEGIAIWDPDARFIAWNTAFAAQFPGVEIEVGMSVYDVLFAFVSTGAIPGYEGREEEWARESYASWQSGVEEERVFQTHDGRWIKSLDRFSPDGLCVGTRMDVTALKTRELELDRARDIAETAERSKAEFLANMSHEIRTPMNGILGMAEILANTELDTRQRKFADIIVTSGNALLTIINDILDFSKIDAGQLTLHSETFDISDAIDDVTSLVSTHIAGRSLEIIVRIAPDLPRNVIGDAGRIRQIITNLVGNAVKFTDTGHVFVNVDGTVGEPDEDDVRHLSLYCRVSDTGIGISPDMVDHIFGKFSQVDGSSTRRHEGTGLGLAITSRLVEIMGGEIGCESVHGEGSTFWFKISLPIDPDEPVAARPPRDMTGSSILVIDDNAVNRAIVLEQIASWGFSGLEASSGEIGLETMRARIAAGERVDTIVLDYHMPDMNGADVARTMRADPALAKIPIVMLTSIDMQTNSPDFLALGINGYLVKPASSTVLLEEIVKANGTSAPTEAADGTVRGPDVLVAEDNMINQTVIGAMLESLGLTFEFVDDGRAAVEGAFELKPRVILMDVSMPLMNGCEATVAIRKAEAGTGRRVKIIGATAHALSGDREMCLQSGMDDYLSKPISAGALRTVLADALDSNEGTALSA